MSSTFDPVIYTLARKTIDFNFLFLVEINLFALNDFNILSEMVEE